MNWLTFRCGPRPIVWRATDSHNCSPCRLSCADADPRGYLRGSVAINGQGGDLVDVGENGFGAPAHDFCAELERSPDCGDVLLSDPTADSIDGLEPVESLSRIVLDFAEFDEDLGPGVRSGVRGENPLDALADGRPDALFEGDAGRMAVFWD